MEYDFDVIVAGSGAGGGTLAADLASRNLNVLVLERGSEEQSLPGDEQQTLIAKQPYDDREIAVNGRTARLYMGGGPGGGTSVYGAALLRPSEDDFHPGRHYGDRIPHEVWDWPISYQDLAPYYDRAEQLYNVAVDPDDDFAPLNASRGDDQNDPIPLTTTNSRLVRRVRAADFKPFRLPLGIQTSECLQCFNCAGFICPTGARRSSLQLISRERESGRAITTLNQREVESIEGLPGPASGLRVRNRSTGAEEFYRARRYVLAAGAIGTPSLLQRSGFEHPLLGRNYMMHYSPLAVGLFARPTGADRTFVKQIGFADFYFGTPHLSEKMGIVQSLPAPGPLMLKKTGLQRVPTMILNLLRRHMLPFVGIVEDLPNPDNRVETQPDGSIRLHHQFSEYDKQRGTALTKEMCRMLKVAGALHCVAQQIPSDQHVAHQCGTVRFGTDPQQAIADRDGRIFGHDNLFVVDGSILPTSLGVGPSLTLMANALRVAGILKAEL